MTNETYPDTLLDTMRTRGDASSDAVIAEVFARGEVDAVNRLMASLVHNDGVPADLPPLVATYLADTARLPPHDPGALLRAEQIFASHGPEVLVALGFYALPASYAAKKGVQVLHRTAYLSKRPMRRVFETTQMVLDVMQPGGLSAGGAGIRTAQKVRLMHAAVRHLLVHGERGPSWPSELGLPINQEDLAGTLMTFSYVVLNGLERLQCGLSNDDQEAYQAAWAVVGHLMGIDPSLIPGSFAEAKLLTERIYARQIAPSQEGADLTRALLEGFETLVPLHVLRGMPRAMIHFFLDDDGVSHRNIREMLGVPEANWSETFIRAVEGFVCNVKRFTAVDVDPLALASRRYGLAMVDALLALERGGARPAFSIPPDLHALWR